MAGGRGAPPSRSSRTPRPSSTTRTRSPRTRRTPASPTRCGTASSATARAPRCSRGPRTAAPPGNRPASSSTRRGGQTLGNLVVALPGGTLVNLFTHLEDGPAAPATRLKAIRSTDRGATWSAARRSRTCCRSARAIPETARPSATARSPAGGRRPDGHAPRRLAGFAILRRGPRRGRLRALDGRRPHLDSAGARERGTAAPPSRPRWPCGPTARSGSPTTTCATTRPRAPRSSPGSSSRDPPTGPLADTRLAGPSTSRPRRRRTGSSWGTTWGSGRRPAFLALYARTTGDVANRTDVFLAPRRRRGKPGETGAPPRRIAQAAAPFTVDAPWQSRIDAATRALARRGGTGPPPS